MELLFKIPDEETTVGASNFQEHYPYVSANMNWALFAVEIRKVTRDIIIPAITADFYNELAAKYHSDEGVGAESEEVLQLLQDCIASYTVWKLSPRINIAIGDAGVQENHGTDGTNPAASAWRYFHHYWTVMKEADQLLDKVLVLLEAGGNTFPKFSTAKAGLVFNDLLIRNAAAFERYVYINKSRRTFLKLIPSIRLAESRKVLPILGDGLYAHLLDVVQKNTLSEDDEKLLSGVQELIAHHALALAVPHLTLSIENNGIFVISSSDGMNTKQTAHKEKLAALIERANTDSEAAEDKLKNFLYLHEDKYPLWKDSPAYALLSNPENYPLDFGHGAIGLD